jgi:hypothetical protein
MLYGDRASQARRCLTRDEQCRTPTDPPDAISDRDLVLNFESIGDNCEFGLVQRMAGAEPLGLLRFSSTPLPLLVRALRARFDGLADPANVLVWGNCSPGVIARRHGL